MRLPQFIRFVPATFIPCARATFGVVMSIRGTVSDIAFDEGRGHVYAGNLSAGLVEVMSTSTLKLQGPSRPAPLPPSCVASRRLWP
jgi:hypothetical protein